MNKEQILSRLNVVWTWVKNATSRESREKVIDWFLSLLIGFGVVLVCCTPFVLLNAWHTASLPQREMCEDRCAALDMVLSEIHVGGGHSTECFCVIADQE